MKLFRVVRWLLPCAIAAACGDSGNPNLEAFEAKLQAMNAIPNDPDLVVYRAKCNNDTTIFPVATSKYNNATLQGQGYRLACDNPNGLEALLNAMGTNITAYNALPVQSCEALGEEYNFATSPTLDCTTATQTNAANHRNMLFSHLDPTTNEYKYYVYHRLFPQDNQGNVLRMLGCLELLQALGYKPEDARELTGFESIFVNMQDTYDINCKGGTVVETRQTLTCDPKPANSLFVAPAGVDPQTGQFVQTWDATAVAFLPLKTDCQWNCAQGFKPVNNNTECAVCAPGETKPGAACGNNLSGNRKVECRNGDWFETQECLGADECQNGTHQQSCGRYGNGTQTRTCTGGAWQGGWGTCSDPDECYGGTNENLQTVCGLNDRGTNWRYCEKNPTSGFWKWRYQCEDPDKCLAAADPRKTGVRCGRGSLGDTYEKCVLTAGVYDWGQSYCVHPDECTAGQQVDYTNISCNGGGYNGKAFRRDTCQLDNAGVYRWATSCVDPDECVAGTTVELGSCQYNGNGRKYKVCRQNGSGGPYLYRTYCDIVGGCTNGEYRLACDPPVSGCHRPQWCTNGAWGPIGGCICP